MNKEWFIWIEEKQHGPYSIQDLKKNPYVTPDTLVWKEGFSSWTPIRDVPELKDIFKDETETKPTEEQDESKKTPSQEIEALTLQRDPINFLIFLLIILIVLFYILAQFYGA